MGPSHRRILHGIPLNLWTVMPSFCPMKFIRKVVDRIPIVHVIITFETGFHENEPKEVDSLGRNAFLQIDVRRGEGVKEAGMDRGLKRSLKS